MSKGNTMAVCGLVMVSVVALFVSAPLNSALAAPPKLKTPKAKAAKFKVPKAVKAGSKARLATRAMRTRYPGYRQRNHYQPSVVARRATRVVGMPVVRRVPSLSITGGPATGVVAGQTYEPTGVKNESQPVAARVVRVIDGQTLLVFSDGDERKVRLLGIDLAAVEEGETALEEAAKLHLEKLVEGKRVSLSYDDSVARKDEDGVEIAYVHRDQDNSFINLRMIRDGYSLAAKAYTYELSDIFSGQQLRAQKRGVGLWASAGPAEAEAEG